ncbi:MAG: ShlB/FhaC/HecB family hemolysin secretion/activation protein [Proteobacteria bacterium]|nr:ShlB/FhaC/HecB family hemolysin secretion/activation protein [Pseudomonadota bacterium]
MWRAALNVGFVAVLLVAGPALAQVSPQVNPGVINQDIERQRQRIEQQQQAPKQQGPSVVGPSRGPAVQVPGGGATFLLRKVVFDKSKFITPEELDAVAAKYVGRRVDIAALQSMVADINAIYAARGIVTAIATLPPQTADKGIVKVKLTEGRLQKTSVVGNHQTSEAFIRRSVDPPKGEVLDVPQLNHDVVRFNRVNEVQLRALLQPGTDFGLTDLQIAVTEPPVNTLQLFFDNQGVQTTGRNEGGIYYKRHGLLGIDDRLTFYGVKSKGNLNGNVAFNMPFNPWGGRIGLSYTQGRIKIVNGQFQTLDVTGTSNQAALNLAQPVWTNDVWLLQATGAYAYGNSESDFSAVAVSNDRYSKTTGGLSLSALAASYSLTVSPGFNTINWHDKILGGERSFNTFTGSTNGTLQLPAQFSAVLLGSWQYTWEKLLPGDQLFSVGGPTTVRGYPTNAASGDSGYYYNLELHRNMSDLIKGLDLFAFFDSGAVFSTFPSVTQLDSAGVGLSWTPYSPITLEASVGVPWRTVIVGQARSEFYGRVTIRPLQLL